MNLNRSEMANEIERFSNKRVPEYMKVPTAMVTAVGAGLVAGSPFGMTVMGIAAVDAVYQGANKTINKEKGVCRVMKVSSHVGPALARLVRG